MPTLGVVACSLMAKRPKKTKTCYVAMPGALYQNVGGKTHLVILVGPGRGCREVPVKPEWMARKVARLLNRDARRRAA